MNVYQNAMTRAPISHASLHGIHTTQTQTMKFAAKSRIWTLALVLGKNSAFALGAPGMMSSGAFRLSGRYVLASKEKILAECLDQFGSMVGVKRIVVFQPAKHHLRSARQSLRSLVDVVEAWSKANGADVTMANAGEVKKNYTGNGNASADLMFDQYDRRGFLRANDDVVTATATLDWAFTRESADRADSDVLTGFQG